MGRRVALAATGAATAGGVLALALAFSPVRGRGLALGLVIIGLLVPTAALVGIRLAFAMTGEPDAVATGKLAALSAPVMVIMVLFLLQVVLGDRASGGQQVIAVVVGTISSAALAARFTGPSSDV